MRKRIHSKPKYQFNCMHLAKYNQAYSKSGLATIVERIELKPRPQYLIVTGIINASYTPP